MLTAVFSALGLVIAVVLRRLAHRPRVAWVRIAVG
ncbi:DUF6069 family protein [uncultured Pseudonocardia sp.]|nr:DUF6069 family protein [uncultured Pseudonocardia sp.]